MTCIGIATLLREIAIKLYVISGNRIGFLYILPVIRKCGFILVSAQEQSRSRMCLSSR
ncbi:hypothetical protein BABINDRAFT_91521 [Babjeviella inositovora NRRL Y-12698]|uniref:Uncharacterized protein n=1 Tax=Babjeviella inositovora NRRL Y-12698 TaxID=984486 RepID=A0A1E3QK32_9ASCO|nr:uncharacterized protein BABINDRAFT_91521 [Babjeviella inositovora NRRL Y-12698]ODQ78010.1 hypothetical protein BABINDRAFT_91521 [Babjeviella inositovora NRRL Y-12698]